MVRVKMKDDKTNGSHILYLRVSKDDPFYYTAKTVDDELAFQATYRRCYPAVLAYCTRRLPLHDAQDVASDVFATAWRRRAASSTSRRCWGSSRLPESSSTTGSS